MLSVFISGEVLMLWKQRLLCDCIQCNSCVWLGKLCRFEVMLCVVIVLVLLVLLCMQVLINSFDESLDFSVMVLKFKCLISQVNSLLWNLSGLWVLCSFLFSEIMWVLLINVCSGLVSVVSGWFSGSVVVWVQLMK